MTDLGGGDWEVVRVIDFNDSVNATPALVDGRVYVVRDQATGAQIDAVLTKAAAAQKEWARTPLAERQA